LTLLTAWQGRLPIRVELKPLTEEDLYLILTVPEANLLRQQVSFCQGPLKHYSFTPCVC
jgi:ATP-dependent HslUV protease ATP-binding subunit HslU